MKLHVKNLPLTILLCCISLSAISQVDIRVLQQGAYVSLDTVHLTIDNNDNSGTGAGMKAIFFNVYNLSATNPEAFYLEAEWLCSNSSAFYQFCQEYPPDYLSGTCQTFHREGIRKYDDYDYLIPPDTCNYNYLQCYFKVYDYSVEQQHEKVCKFSIKRKNTHEVLDIMYLVIRRGNLPCNTSQPVGIHAPSADDVAEIYPNPTSNFFTIAAKQDQLMGCALYSPDGKMIVDKTIETGKKVNINTMSLSNGVYYLKLTDKAGRSFYKKIAVDH